MRLLPGESPSAFALQVFRESLTSVAELRAGRVIDGPVGRAIRRERVLRAGNPGEFDLDAGETEDLRRELVPRARTLVGDVVYALEEEREHFLIEANRLDPSRNIHTMLRLTKARERLRWRGPLGGALLLNLMVETLRRQF